MHRSQIIQSKVLLSHLPTLEPSLSSLGEEAIGAQRERAAFPMHAESARGARGAVRAVLDKEKRSNEASSCCWLLLWSSSTLLPLPGTAGSSLAPRRRRRVPPPFLCMFRSGLGSGVGPVPKLGRLRAKNYPFKDPKRAEAAPANHCATPRSEKSRRQAGGSATVAARRDIPLPCCLPFAFSG